MPPRSHIAKQIIAQVYVIFPPFVIGSLTIPSSGSTLIFLLFQTSLEF